MSASDALRRRRRPSLRTRIRIVWVFLALAACAAAAAAWTLVTLPQLQTGRVGVRVAGSEIPPAEIRARAAIDPHANAWLLDTDAIARRIEAIPRVATAVVERTPPAHVVLAVTERTPYACLHAGTRKLTIDRDHRVLADGCSAGVPIFDIPALTAAPGAFLHDAALVQLDAAARALGAAGIEVRSLRFDPYGQLIAVDRRGIALLLGDGDAFARKIALIGPVLAAAGSRRVEAVDLRAPDTPIVRYR